MKPLAWVLAAVALTACGGTAADLPPTALSQSVTTAEDTAVTIDVNAEDPEGKALTLTATTSTCCR